MREDLLLPQYLQTSSPRSFVSRPCSCMIDEATHLVKSWIGLLLKDGAYFSLCFRRVRAVATKYILRMGWVLTSSSCTLYEGSNPC